MEYSLAMDKMEKKRKRKKTRRRIRRLLFLGLLITFFTQTEQGLGVISRLSDTEVYDLLNYAKVAGDFVLSIIPKLQEIVGDGMAYVANFL